MSRGCLQGAGLCLCFVAVTAVTAVSRVPGSLQSDANAGRLSVLSQITLCWFGSSSFSESQQCSCAQHVAEAAASAQVCPKQTGALLLQPSVACPAATCQEGG